MFSSIGSDTINLLQGLGPLAILVFLLGREYIIRREQRNGNDPSRRLEAVLSRQTETLRDALDGQTKEIERQTRLLEKQSESFAGFYREFAAHRALMERPEK